MRTWLVVWMSVLLMMSGVLVAPSINHMDAQAAPVKPPIYSQDRFGYSGTMSSYDEVTSPIMTGYNSWPSAPSSLNATNIFKRNFRINWTAAADNVGIKSYDIFVNGSYRGTAAANTNFFLVSGLTAGTTYSVRVSATDLDNNTTSSAAVSVTTAP